MEDSWLRCSALVSSIEDLSSGTIASSVESSPCITVFAAGERGYSTIEDIVELQSKYKPKIPLVRAR